MKFDASVEKGIVESLTSALEKQTQNLGIVEAAATVTRDGQPGFLVWHYVFHSEVSFVSESGQIESLYTSVGDEYAKNEYERLKTEWTA